MLTGIDCDAKLILCWCLGLAGFDAGCLLLDGCLELASFEAGLLLDDCAGAPPFSNSMKACTVFKFVG